VEPRHRQRFCECAGDGGRLGTMGQQGVDLASFWGLDDASYPSAFAFLMMRDYDGNGSAFGDTSISATSANTFGTYRLRCAAEHG
jgi:hypothetical protein